MSIKKTTRALPNVLLQQARRERRWSQQDLAEAIDAPQAFMISRWENGTAFPHPNYRKKLCQVFGRQPEELGLIKETTQHLTALMHISVHDPSIPQRFFHAQPLLGRGQLLEQIRQQLCTEDDNTLSVLHGLPGVGKTALATEVVHLPEVRKHFRHGVLWAELGPHPQFFAVWRNWGRILGLSEAECALLKDGDAWTQVLQRTIGSRHMLLVIDDAWSAEDALNCMLGGPHCSYLVTTRVTQVATYFANEQAIQVSELTMEDGIRLLCQKAPMLLEVKPATLQSLVQLAGGLPLALALMGNYLACQTISRQPRRLHKALDCLRQRETRLYLQQPQAGPNRDRRLPIGAPLSLQAVIGFSAARLDTSLRRVLSDLSILPTSPDTFSEKVALAVAATTPDALDRLVDNGLLAYKGSEQYQFHQTIADYFSLQHTDVLAEQRLVEYVLQYLEHHCLEDLSQEQDGSLMLAALESATSLGYHPPFHTLYLHKNSFAEPIRSL